MHSVHSNSNDPVQVLIDQLSKVPGFGKRSAMRAVYHMLNNKEKILIPFVNQLNNVMHNITQCSECYNIAFDTLCHICKNIKRDQTSICIVEKPQDISVIEKAQFYNGIYHVIGGLLSAFNGVTPQDLKIDSLLKRIKTHHVTEIIFALPSTQDARTTIHFISDKVADYNLKITMPAQGMPLGSDLEFIDQGTMTTAFNARIHIT